MRELRDAGWIKLKAALFLVIGLGSAALLLRESPSLKSGFLIVVAIWAFCRLYYFAFYVIEHYLDGSYRFSGLISCLRYLLLKRANAKE